MTPQPTTTAAEIRWQRMHDLIGWYVQLPQGNRRVFESVVVDACKPKQKSSSKIKVMVNRLVNETVNRCNGNVSEAAKQLGCHRATVWQHMGKAICILLASTICSFAQRGTGANPVATTSPTPVSIFSLPQAAVAPFRQTLLTWDNDAGASNRVSWGLARNAWTNGSRLVFTNTFPVTNGWTYAVTQIVNGVESFPALWPSNRIGELWLTGYTTNLSSKTNIAKLVSFTNTPPGVMSFWGIENRTTGWQ